VPTKPQFWLSLQFPDVGLLPDQLNVAARTSELSPRKSAESKTVVEVLRASCRRTIVLIQFIILIFLLNEQ
jgi:hypothetical protein